MEILQSGKHEVKIDQGELVSYTFSGKELIHQKGKPGWKHADTEMFPIIGPTEAVGYRVQVPRGNAVQDQHGLLRELEYELLETSNSSAIYLKTYTAGSVVKNSKYPDKSRMQFLMWPYSFEFRKIFTLNTTGLTITFELKGEPDMPYMLGYHPAFNLQTAHPVVIAGGKEIQLKDIIAAGSNALELANCSEIVLKDAISISIKTSGFDNFMFWTEVPNMLCIEPVTFYPYSAPVQLLHEGFHYLGRESKQFRVEIIPREYD
ncbi:MAG: aldose 1-epimerase [Eudoraea sp.]|nr:aldose 1-epimerase [Eudoraea sp.]NNK31467.1 aldose 1-epimerase [Flavobacteriaceae bacterium]